MIHPAYVAGFVDADGCLSIDFSRISRRADRPTSRFRVACIIVQKNWTTLKAIHDIYGGSYNKVKRGNRAYWRLDVSGKALLALLMDILPYMIDKKEQVLLAIEANQHQSECGRGRYRAGCEGTQPLTEHDLAYREAMWLRMKELNTCHKIHAAAETNPSDPEKGCDSPSLSVMTRGIVTTMSVAHKKVA